MTYTSRITKHKTELTTIIKHDKALISISIKIILNTEMTYTMRDRITLMKSIRGKIALMKVTKCYMVGTHTKR